MSPGGDRASSRRARLLSRIHRRYATRTEQVQIGGLEIPFTRIADPDRVLDEVADAADRRERLTGRRISDEHLHLPYWAELWDSAVGLGQWLVRHAAVGPRDEGFRVQVSGQEMGFKIQVAGEGSAPSVTPELQTMNFPTESQAPNPILRLGIGHRPSAIFTQSRTLTPLAVLDLGCGMGLAGTVAAALGHRLLFADLEPAALLFARLNSLPWPGRTRARRLDWRVDRLDESFDLVLGADILYERGQWEHLEQFWRCHLAPGGAVLLGEPGRQTGELFVEWIRARGWNLRESQERVATRPTPIRLFCLTLH